MPPLPSVKENRQKFSPEKRAKIDLKRAKNGILDQKCLFLVDLENAPSPAPLCGQNPPNSI